MLNSKLEEHPDVLGAKWKGQLRAILKLAISLGMIAALVLWLDWSSVARALVTADAIYLTMGLLAMAPTVSLAAWRWSYAARASSIHLPIAFFLKATYSALFVGQFLPAGIGVDAARLAYFMHGRARLAYALQSLVLDRLLGAVSAVTVMAIGLPLIWDSLPAIIRIFACSIVAATALGLIAILSLHRVDYITKYPGEGKRRKLIDLALSVRRSIASVESAMAFVISLAIYCLMILGVHLIAHAIGVETSYASLLAIVALAMFVALLPISVNGWGVREGAMVAGLAVLGVVKESALAISLLFGFASAVITLPGIVLWHLRQKQGAGAISE